MWREEWLLYIQQPMHSYAKQTLWSKTQDIFVILLPGKHELVAQLG